MQYALRKQRLGVGSVSLSMVLVTLFQARPPAPYPFPAPLPPLSPPLPGTPKPFSPAPAPYPWPPRGTHPQNIPCGVCVPGVLRVGRLVHGESHPHDDGHHDGRLRLHAGIRRPVLGALHLLPAGALSPLSLPLSPLSLFAFSLSSLSRSLSSLSDPAPSRRTTPVWCPSSPLLPAKTSPAHLPY